MFIIGLYSSYHSYFSPADMPQEKYHSLAQFATKKIAIIEVSGAIMEGEDSFAEKQIDRVREDDSDVVGIVVRVNSPGGTVTGSDYIYHHLRELAEKRKLPIVVSMGSVCASGGYYVAMAVGSQPDAIFAEPTTWTGSIGVIIPHFDVSGGLAKLGISRRLDRECPAQEDGLAHAADVAEEKKIHANAGRRQLQRLQGDRRQRPAEVQRRCSRRSDAVATGQIFTAKQALDKGLVDKIGFIEAAIARATELAGENAESVRCVKYEKRPTFFGAMLGSRTQARRPAAMHDCRR